MTQLPTHTPYDGSSKLFHDRAEAARSRRTGSRSTRHSISSSPRSGASTPNMPTRSSSPRTAREDAQREVLALLDANICRRGFPSATGAMDERLTSPAIPALDGLETRDLPPLHAASLLVQEDLILMRRGETGWRLAAGSLCFPSSWLLTEKFGKPMQRDPRAGAGFRAGHAQRRADRPHVRQAAGRPAGRALQLVDPGGRRALPSAVAMPSASTAPPAGRSAFRTSSRRPAPSSASSGRR